jgi:hypothetical protein
MSNTQYPKGTTKEQWDRYEAELKNHKEFIANYMFFLNRIVKHLEWAHPNQTWTTKEISHVICTEIGHASSMSAPNKPGYEYANND